MSIERYSRYCGPASVAAALGISRASAAKLLRRCGEHRSSTTHVKYIAKALGSPLTKVRRKGYEGTPVYPYYRNCPTVREWLKKNQNKRAILRASKHFIYVEYGKVIEDNGYKPMKGKVNYAIIL